MNLNTTSLLSGKAIIITRAKSQESSTRKSLESLGARVLDLPSLVIGSPDEWGPLDDALLELDSFHWLIFSSSNGVEALETRLGLQGKSLSSRPNTLKIAAVGRKTANCLEDVGIKADFIPPNFVADSLIDNFPAPVYGLKMLLPRVQTGGRTLLTQAFGEAGARVVEVAAYESRCPENIPEITSNALMNQEVDIITFTSSKTVINTVKLMNKAFGNTWHQKLENVKIISIGPQTSKTCEKYFFRVDEEAIPHDIDGLIKACIKSLKSES